MTRSPRERALTLRPHEVRAVLAGATQHWVPMRPQPERIADWSCPGVDGLNFGWMTVSESVLRENPQDPETVSRAPLNISDRAWVRETHARFSVGEGLDTPVPECVAYRATCDDSSGFEYTNGRGEIMRLRVTKWTPATLMPRWASRILLEVTAVRVARIQDVTEEDARAMGYRGVRGAVGQMIPGPPTTAREGLRAAWDGMHGPDAWDRNDWCWARTFRRVEEP